MTTQEAFERQEKIIKYYKESNPNILKRDKNISEAEVFNEIGMWNMPKDRVGGYMRLFPQDFIVEEKTKNDKVIRINEINKQDINSNNANDKKRTLYSHLIKIGIPTNVAVERISKSLNFNINKIGYAGLKDADAITAQLVAFPGIGMSISEIEKVNIPNVLLTDFYYYTGSLHPGDLKENIFTITIRAKEKVEKSNLQIQLENIEKYGVLNYFQAQRFGGLRLISHKLGKLIMQGRYELAVKYFLFKTNDYDIPLVVGMRKEAEKKFPDWQNIEKLYQQLPYSFFNELKLINYLKNDPENFIGALINIEDQTQLWAYAYSSWLFNKHLSEYSKIKGCINEKFPILLSNIPQDNKIYWKFLQEDQTLDYAKNLFPFKFIRLKQRFISGRIFPKIINYKIQDKIIIINFSLQKGSYATTFLSNLFELYQGLPIPEWADLKEIDPKEMIGQGNIKEIREIFKNYWYSKLD